MPLDLILSNQVKGWLTCVFSVRNCVLPYKHKFHLHHHHHHHYHYLLSVTWILSFILITCLKSTTKGPVVCQNGRRARQTHSPGEAQEAKQILGSKQTWTIPSLLSSVATMLSGTQVVLNILPSSTYGCMCNYVH